MSKRGLKILVSVALVLTLVAGAGFLLRTVFTSNRVHLTAYFDNSNGVFPGDEIRILGVPVGAIEAIEPQPESVKVTFWVDKKYKVPAEVQAAILSPSLVTARAIQLTPAYTSGPVIKPGAVIPLNRTLVPVEWDDLREQLEKLTQTLQPNEPGGVSPLGAFLNTTADNLRGQGADIRQAIIKMSEAFSALGDHSKDIFGTIKSLSTLVTALKASTDVMRQLNGNLSAVSGLVANSPNEIGQAVGDLNTAVTDVKAFLTENTETVGTTSDELAKLAAALGESRDEIQQFLHIGPTTVQNLSNIYQPAQNALTGILALNNFANPVSFLCGAVQAASRLGAEQSAKLCVQYLAPIMKNRQFNFLPFGLNPFVGATARPNEVTYSEDWLRPDYRPTPPPDNPAPANVPPPAGNPAPLPAEAVPTNPDAGLSGMMTPPGGGS
ncbi:phospholipid/cholesterol/gamma-HCH transport system substrate-binding protein [Mycolicibacterium sp. BK556]|uniref:MCE family protein n=1 Tax=Mycobacteriaceae TaxID=1762 RepID=UPI001060D09D|nr:MULTISPECIES: MCE family protein [Mycobacteriaceae]MBB3600579.1 phospholipid/cholesterol/gamma-HCH transport system substrate-binding protein [Mycolicibacterium sp. BK556]MBB3630332.1 phospholipid/cholesterol/gamma-HCH transport system substrate-binding protein [Mycolicibacterium sp. BK607]MBB3748331.1 phospholipid/cholesterol/gamma-HCH transport system substrate-binding protein [Mycolicibacterium sp. BK634]TDO10121.1 phospholipid/cholesterol/gamma-HCH transport system substrate-binding prot